MAWDKTKPANDELLSNTPALLRANWQALEDMTDAALLITNAKVAAAAGIVDTKLATISTAGKVSGAALTSLTSVPAGAGKVPVANIDTGTTANKIVILDGSGFLPAVSGTNLTGIPCSAIASGTMAPARLGSGTAAATTFLTGAGAWGTVPQGATTNIVFEAHGSLGGTSNNVSFGISGLASGNMNWYFSGNYEGNFSLPYIRTKYKKLSNHSTLTLYYYASIANDSTFKWTVGSLVPTDYYASGSGAAWRSTSLNVSSLTTDTIYDMDLRGQSAGSCSVWDAVVFAS